MPFARVENRLFIEDNTFYLADPQDADGPLYAEAPFPDFAPTGLVAAVPGGAVLVCGVHLGDVTVAVELWDAPPPVPDGWDDIAEVSTSFPNTPSVCGAQVDPPSDFEIPFPEDWKAADLRLRACVRDRDAGEDRDEEDPPEVHLIQLWRSPKAKAALLKATDETGAMWRSGD